LIRALLGRIYLACLKDIPELYLRGRRSNRGGRSPLNHKGEEIADLG